METLIESARYEPAPKPGQIWHKWLGLEPPRPWDNPKTLVLCWKITGERPSDFDNDDGFVTVNNANVTCQECNEFLHA